MFSTSPVSIGEGGRGSGVSFGTEHLGKSALDSGNFYTLFAQIYGKKRPEIVTLTINDFIAFRFSQAS